MSWEEWFGFSCDPFDPKPLQGEDRFRELLVRTKPIRERIEPLLEQIKEEPFCKTIIGERGIGKSTVLRYCVHKAKQSGIIPIFIKFHPASIAKASTPAFDCMVQIMRQIVQQEITSIHELYHDVFEKYEQQFIRAAKYVGLGYSDTEGFFKDPLATMGADISLLEETLTEILQIGIRFKIYSLVAIDNLDKLDFHVVLTFLSGQMAQPLFEHLMDKGCSIFLAVHPSLEDKMRTEEDLSYLGERIQLVGLSPDEAAKLVEERVKFFCEDPNLKSSIKVDRNLISRVCNEKKGNTREILREFSDLFHIAYERKVRHLTLELYEKRLEKGGWSPSAYYEILDQNPKAKRAAEKISILVSSLPSEELEKSRGLLLKLAEGQKVDAYPKTLKTLVDVGILEETKRGRSHQLRFHKDVEELLDQVSKRGWPVSNLLSWIMAKDMARIIKPKYSTFKTRQLISSARKILSCSHQKTGKVTVIVDTMDGEKSVQWPFPEYYLKCHEFLDLAQAYYDRLVQQEWEDVDTADAFENIYFTLLNFLLAFTYYYILYSKTPIRTRRERYWPLIFSVINDLRRKGIPLKSKLKILGIRRIQYSIKSGGQPPPIDEINKRMQTLEKIIEEVSQLWQSLSKSHLTLQEKYREEAEEIRKTLIEAAEGGSWTRVNDQQMLDLVATKDFELPTGKKRSYVLLVSIKAGPPREKDFLNFFASCQEVIENKEKEKVKKDFLKPHYHLWYISTRKIESRFPYPKLPAPQNRVFIKYLHTREISKAFKEVGLEDSPPFLDLSKETLNPEDRKAFTRFRDEWLTEDPLTVANHALDYFELRMRSIVEAVLKYHFDDDWFTRSTIPMKLEIEKRIQQERQRVPVGLGKEEEKPLNFCHISDLKEIITKADNWKECFGVFFNRSEENKERFKVYMDEIRDLRNAVKHVRGISRVSRADVLHVLQNMTWVLSFLDRYELLDIFDKGKAIRVESKNGKKLVILGRISSLISKEDADKFDKSIKKLAGNEVFKKGGSFNLNLGKLETLFKISRKKAILLLTLSKHHNLVEIEKLSSDEYKVSIKPR